MFNSEIILEFKLFYRKKNQKKFDGFKLKKKYQKSPLLMLKFLLQKNPFTEKNFQLSILLKKNI